jgi:hypothetical protein
MKKKEGFAALVVVIIARRQPCVDASLVVLDVFALKPYMPTFGEKVLVRLKLRVELSKEANVGRLQRHVTMLREV